MKKKKTKRKLPEAKTITPMPEVKSPVVVSPKSPIEMMMIAVDGGLDLDKVDKILDLQAKHDAMQSKKEYTKAMSDFKTIPLVITKDKANNQYNSKYTTLGNLINTVVPVMSEVGLSHKWAIDQSEKIKVTCIVTHVSGHSEETTMIAPLDDSGRKNPIQQIKSTITYLKACTFESAMGLASSDANYDDDGNSSNITFISKEQVKQLQDIIDGAGIDEEDYLKWANVKSLDQIEERWFAKCISTLQAKVTE